MYKGELSLVIDIPPLTLTFTSASGAPSAVVAVTPANLPFSASAAEFTGTSFKSFAVIEETELDNSFFFKVP